MDPGVEIALISGVFGLLVVVIPLLVGLWVKVAVVKENVDGRLSQSLALANQTQAELAQLKGMLTIYFTHGTGKDAVDAAVAAPPPSVPPERKI